MSNRKQDDGGSERQRLDDLEPLESHSEERQEPDDDYYIRNYVLRETSEEAKKEAPPTPVADAEAKEEPAATEPVTEEAQPVAEEPPSQPGFGSRTYTPTAEVAQPASSRAEVSPTAVSALTREELLTDTLSDLLSSAPDIEAAVLVSMDGLAMASALPDAMEEDRVAAMSAAILGLGERASAELGRGTLNQVFVEGEDGYVFLMSAGGKAVLTALASRGVKIGLVFYDMKHAAQRIADIL